MVIFYRQVLSMSTCSGAHIHRREWLNCSQLGEHQAHRPPLCTPSEPMILISQHDGCYKVESIISTTERPKVLRGHLYSPKGSGLEDFEPCKRRHLIRGLTESRSSIRPVVSRQLQHEHTQCNIYFGSKNEPIHEASLGGRHLTRHLPLLGAYLTWPERIWCT
ncbi:hypothetical protein LZ30DRAFT_34350 [Colletotrichum cereale]|nr:hypothetical protein LZ30DRAFT_34350 [Colletotrichum cereale]